MKRGSSETRLLDTSSPPASICRICEQERPATEAEIEILLRAGYPRDPGLCPLCLIFKTALEDGRG